MRFLLAPLTQKTLSLVLHRAVALMDPNNGGADLTLQPETWQFAMIAFRGKFLERGACVAEEMHVCLFWGFFGYESLYVCILHCPVSGAAGRRTEDE